MRHEDRAAWEYAMIMRVLRAKVKSGKLKEYQRLCEEKSFPHLRATPGLIAMHMGAPLVSQPDEFVVVTVWRDLDALVGFAGEQWREVVVLPGEAELVDEMVVEHYDDSLRALSDVWRINSIDLGDIEQTLLKTLKLSDSQWACICPLLPAHNREGRPRADDRRTVEGILYVLRTGCRWQDLPREYGSAVTCWRRFVAWETDGTWARIWQALLPTLDTAARMAWAQALLDGKVVPSKPGRHHAE
jgi:transposase/heme-degrading monooxygenase HmoA